MATENLTYVEIGERLGVSAHAARALARRLHLPRVLDNQGRARVSIDFAEIQHKPQPTAHVGRPDAEQATVAALQEEVAALVAELAAERRRSDGHQAALHEAAAAAERERERADRIMTAYERLAAVHEQMAGDVAALRGLSSDHERDRANRERERADSLAEVQLPALRFILESQGSMADDVAALRGLLKRVDHERDRANRERDRANSLADLELPTMRTILETQDGMAGDVATLRDLLEHAYGVGEADVNDDSSDTDAAGETDADTGAAVNGDARRRSWWWPFRRAG
jgi:hypothetical protein